MRRAGPPLVDTELRRARNKARRWKALAKRYRAWWRDAEALVEVVLGHAREETERDGEERDDG
jgi:hypothetical protein